MTESAIVAARLIVGTVVKSNSDTVSRRQRHQPGASPWHECANRISRQSDGLPGSDALKVPNVVGMAQAKAQSILVAAKLVVGTITTATSAKVPRELHSQSPAAGVKHRKTPPSI